MKRDGGILFFFSCDVASVHCEIETQALSLELRRRLEQSLLLVADV